MNAIFAYIGVLRLRKPSVQTLLPESKVTRSKLPHISWLVLSHFICSSHLCATTIIVCANSDSIVVAADSKVTTKTGETVQLLDCKIRKIDDSVFLASAGIMGNRDIVPDLAEIIPHLMTSSGGPTIRAKIDAVCLMVEGILMIPKFFKEAEPEELVLQLIFFYKENDTLKLAVRQFTKIDGTSGRFIILPLDTSLVNVPMLHLLSERPDAANRLVDNKPDWYTRMSLIEKARVLIDLAVAEDSSRSGPPIDIICLTRHGSTWIKKKPQCQDP